MTRKPIKFAHVVYRTRRFEEMVSWYETVFGAKVQHENPVMAFLTYDDEHHRFAFVNLAVVDPIGTRDTDRRGAVGVDHVIYGWVFFGIVIGLMFFIGMAEPPRPPPPRAITSLTYGRRGRFDRQPSCSSGGPRRRGPSDIGVRLSQVACLR